MGTAKQPESKKSSLLQTLPLFLLGALVGAVVVYLAIAQPAQQKTAKVESQRQTMVNILVKLGQKKACAAKTFDEAVGVESLTRDTLRDANVNFPEDARQKIELCAESLRHKVEGPPKLVHKRIGKKK